MENVAAGNGSISVNNLKTQTLINMICPKCNSENVQKLSVVYESGTHNINTQSNTAGGGYAFGNGGGFFTVGATTRTRGIQQSMLAEKATPPKKRPYFPCVAFFFGILFILLDFVFLGVVFMIVSPIYGYFAYQYNTHTWPNLYHEWNALWHCNKCGELYLA